MLSAARQRLGGSVALSNHQNQAPTRSEYVPKLLILDLLAFSCSNLLAGGDPATTWIFWLEFGE